MASYLVTDPQSGRKLRLTGDSAPTEKELEQIFSSQPKSVLQKADSAFLAIPGAKQVSEVAGGFNRAVGGMVDTFAINPVNSVMQLAGSSRRIPSAQGMAAPKGSFTGPGLQADILGAAGETAAMGVAAGGALRTAASAIPQAAQSVGANVMRQMGRTTTAADAAMGAASGAGAVAGEKAGGKPGAFVGALAAPALPSLLKSGGSEIVRQIFRGSSKNIPNIQNALDDAARAGTSLNVGEATGRRSIQATQNISGKVAGGGPIPAAAEQSATNMKNRLSSIADSISGTVKGDEGAGRVITASITGRGGFLDRFKGQSSVLWNNVDDAIGRDNMVSIDNTKRVLSDLVRTDVLGKILNTPKTAELKNALGDVTDIDYGTLRELRTVIGQKMSSADLISDVPKADLKRLYGAISEDIRSEAMRAGPDVMKAFNRANNYTRSGHDRIDGFIENVMRKADFSKVFDAVTKGGEGSQTINAFKRSMKPEEWEVVVSNVVRQLGKANPGQQGAEGIDFSINKFLTDWNKIGPAKRALFSGSRTLDHYGRDLDAIARTAERIKSSATVGANPSGTAQMTTNITAGVSLGTGIATGNVPLIATTLGAISANNAYARLMTNPRFVGWMAGTTKGPQDMGAQLTKLAAFQQNMPIEDALAVDSLIQELSQNQGEN